MIVILLAMNIAVRLETGLPHPPPLRCGPSQPPHCSLALDIAVHLVIELYKKSYKVSNQAS
jgi:hypothetical protein